MAIYSGLLSLPTEDGGGGRERWLRSQVTEYLALQLSCLLLLFHDREVPLVLCPVRRPDTVALSFPAHSVLYSCFGLKIMLLWFVLLCRTSLYQKALNQPANECCGLLLHPPKEEKSTTTKIPLLLLNSVAHLYAALRGSHR